MRKNITNEEYEFSSLNDMYKFLTSDNVDDFLIDFGGMLKQTVLIREQVVADLKDKNLLEAIDLDDLIEIDRFTWTDDGEHDATLTMRFDVPDEGEEEYKNHQM